MIERRSICLDENSLKKIQPYVKKNKGNLSSAIRDLIEIGHMLMNLNNNTAVDEGSLHSMFSRNDYIESGKGVILPVPFFIWTLDRCIGEVPSESVIREIDYDVWKEKALDMSELDYEDFIHMIFKTLRNWAWPVSVKTIGMDDSKKKLYVEISGNEFLINRHAAIFLIINLSLHRFKLLRAEELSQKVILTFIQQEDEKGSIALLRSFGENQIFYNNIERHMSFWKHMVNLFETNDYDLAIVSPSTLETTFKEYPEQLSSMISAFKFLFTKNIDEIPLEKFMSYFTGFCEVTKLFKRVEWNGSEMVIYYTYSEREVIDLIKETLLTLFNETGESFSIKELDQRLVLQRK